MGILQAFWYIYTQKHCVLSLRVTGESSTVHGESLIPLTSGSVLICVWLLRKGSFFLKNMMLKLLDGNGSISQHIKKVRVAPFLPKTVIGGPC